MKLSLAWIFDHIQDASWKELDIPALIHRCNLTIGEIDDVKNVTLDLASFTIGQVTDTAATVTVFSAEHGTDITLPARDDVRVGQLYLLKQDKKGWRWATLADWSSSKDGLLPAIACDDALVAGAWKNDFEVEDYILEISNTSITHRPDMWGHRGVARELAAMLGKKLVPEEQLLSNVALTVREYEHFAAATEQHNVTIDMKAPGVCTRLAALVIPEIAVTASLLPMAYRLTKVDGKPINAIVDATNYVMFDSSQPMHAFDQQKLASSTLMPRMAVAGESLALLDGHTIELSPDDLVITDGKQPIGLAGVMGGSSTKVTETTTSLIVESGWFDPGHVRKSAILHKKRTESSSRFEKNLDPMQNLFALKRFVSLLVSNKIVCQLPTEIVSVGNIVQPKVIEISHDRIERALGAQIPSAKIVEILSLLGMQVAVDNNNYRITVPTFRSTRDVMIPEDIIEEVGRFYGYGNIPQVLPALPLQASSHEALYNIRRTKRLCATVLQAREVANYPLYDEEFLKTLSYVPTNPVVLKNPISDSSTMMVTSLVPHLLKNVVVNKLQEQQVRFFEWARVWHQVGDQVTERKQLAGIIGDSKQAVDFYAIKAELLTMFHSLHMDISWHTSKELEPWYHPYKTAALHLDGKAIGYAGTLHPLYAQAIGVRDGFIFQLDGQVILDARQDQATYQPLSKYQDTWFDVSMMIATSVSVATIATIIQGADARIFAVKLIDTFHKAEWGDERSVTMRFFARDEHATLSKEQIDAIYQTVMHKLVAQGAQIR